MLNYTLLPSIFAQRTAPGDLELSELAPRFFVFGAIAQGLDDEDKQQQVKTSGHKRVPELLQRMTGLTWIILVVFLANAFLLANRLFRPRD